jgi:flagellar hook-associated protein 2
MLPAAGVPRRGRCSRSASNAARLTAARFTAALFTATRLHRRFAAPPLCFTAEPLHRRTASGPQRKESNTMPSRPSFNAGGLASGLDSNSIIDSLVTIQSAPLTLLRGKQNGIRTQVTLLGGLASKLSSLKTAATVLGSAGVLGVTAANNPMGATATPGPTSRAGRYAITVDALANSARARSQAFDSGFAPVTGGTLTVGYDGQSFDVAIADGATLNDVATSINAQAPNVSAVVLFDGTKSYLSLTRLDTGFDSATGAASALTLSETSTGSLGQPLSAAITQTATNAKVTVDGLAFTRRNNTFDDVVPGTMLSLSGLTTAPSDLVLTHNATTTQSNLQAFVDAYNAVNTVVQGQLAVNDTSNRANSLAGDGIVRAVQSALRSMVNTPVTGLTNVRALADLGLKTARDGSLSIDTATLTAAIGRDPQAINQLFSQATTGLSKVISNAVDGFIDSTNGVLTTRTDSLNKAVTRLDDDQARLQARLDVYRAKLVAQYTAMENVVSSYKSIGALLTQQDNARTSNR